MNDRQPAFVWSGPTGALQAYRPMAGFADVAEARAALSRGAVPMIAGALAFHPEHPAALLAPREVRRSTALPGWPTGPLPAVRLAAAVPAATEHRARICRALDELSRRATTLRKVVLARRLELAAAAPLDPRMVLRRLVDADPAGYGYLVDLSAAGPGFAGAVLVGASPELLVTRDGDRVSCRPFAGSAARAADPAADAASGAALARSGKNRHEHQLVVDQLSALLHPLCSAVDIAPEPELSRTAAVWHLSTPITATLRDPSTTAMDLAIALHPTAAVGGIPTAQAVQLIRSLEGDRGFYAGAVGWCDHTGDGSWAVSIRCAQLSADRRWAVAYAGGGIVAESDPDDELAETTAKFATILSALGVAPSSEPPPA